jgi:hypothetical protein
VLVHTAVDWISLAARLLTYIRAILHAIYWRWLIASREVLRKKDLNVWHTVLYGVSSEGDGSVNLSAPFDAL